MRASANLTVGNINTLTLRSKANLGSYQLRSGVNVIPNSIVECQDSAEPFMEILRSLHGMNATQFPLRFRRSYFLNDDANRINEYSFAPEHGQFVIALEMESLVRNSDKLLSGTDGRSADMFLDLVFNYRSVTSAVANDLFTYTNTMAAAANITAQMRIDVFINYDLYLILDVVNGIVQTEI
jgi:hypothetical protein